MYSGGQSGEMVGEAIAGRRKDVVLATKANMPMGDEPNHQGSSRRWLITALDDSLPLASGWLSGAIREGQEVGTNRSTFMPERFDASISSNRARLDAIDAIVAPGVDLAAHEKFDATPALLDPSLRRR